MLFTHLSTFYVKPKKRYLCFSKKFNIISNVWARRNPWLGKLIPTAVGEESMETVKDAIDQIYQYVDSNPLQCTNTINKKLHKLFLINFTFHTRDREQKCIHILSNVII